MHPKIEESGLGIRRSICGEYTTTRVLCFFNMYKRQPLGTQGGTKNDAMTLTSMHTLKKLMTGLFIILLSNIFCAKAHAQVEDTLRRHFIISIDKYPDKNGYIFSPFMMDTVSSILNREFHINEYDFVSIVYYGIGAENTKISDFINTTSKLIWLSGHDYLKKWRQYQHRVLFSDNGGRFSVQECAKECSFLFVPQDEKCNTTYVIRITDNKGNYGGNKLKAQNDLLSLKEGSSPIDLSDWQRIKDSVSDHYTFEKPDCGVRSFYSIDGLYGVYIDQVVSKDRPSTGSVVDISEINVRQVRNGHRITFKYHENGNYTLERICVSYMSKNGWKIIYDTIHTAKDDVSCLLDNVPTDTLKLNIKVWGSNKMACCPMVISPYDEIAGKQLQEERIIQLGQAKIFGIPLTKGWPWFSDNAELTALIWMLILVAISVGTLFFLYYAMRKYKVSSDKITMEAVGLSPIAVNLLDKTEGSKLAAKISIDIKKPVWSKGRIIREKVVFEIHLNSKEETCVKTNGTVFFLDKEGNKISNGKSFTIRDYKTDLQVNVNPNAIIDCEKPQTEENCHQKYILPAIVTLKKKSGEPLKELPINFEITFTEIKHLPQIHILNKEHKEISIVELKYDSDSISRSPIAFISLTNTIEKQRKPTLSNPTASLQCSNCEALSIEDSVIVLDMSKLENPSKTYSDYQYSLIYNYEEEGYAGKEKISKDFTLRVKQNTTLPQLRVWVKDKKSTKNEELKDKETMKLSDVHFIPGDALSQFWSEIVIENAATQGRTGAAIKVTDVQIIPEVTQEKAPRYDELAFVQSIPTKDDVVMYNVGDIRTQIRLRVGWNGTNRQVDYDEDNGVRRYDFTVRLTLTFKYKIDTIGNGTFGSPLEYKSVLDYKVYQDAHREWLGVDFGTSAIVAQYGDNIIDLRTRKRALYENSPYVGDTYEVGTNFLSSSVIFRDAAGEDENVYPSSEYEGAAICLSPTSTLEQSCNKGMLPCLKLMVGYERLPNIESLRNQHYKYGNHSVKFGEDVDNPLEKVENVFREVYQQLIRDFILPVMGDNPVDNVVLTVPNTYTSMHLGILEECIKNSSIGDKVRNVHFVSESDAVACYYQSNWTPLNPGRNSLNNEYILVYDMGAGTTDVSLIHRQVQGENTVLQVKGKVGIGCAGNYLDTVLAETIATMNPDEDLKKYLGIIRDSDEFKKAASYKQLIKDVVKPLMNSTEDELTLTKDQCDSIGIDPDFIINLNELRGSAEYRSCIQSCTSDFLDDFFSFLGYNKQGNRPRIDTLVLSGRASNQKILIDKLKVGLAEWCEEGSDMKVVPLWAGNHDASKTAVIEGAVNYVSRYMREDSGVTFKSSNITADYGITFQDATGATRYLCLLRHDEEPSGTIVFNGIVHSIYHCDHTNLDLHTVNQLTLIQAYTKTPVNEDGSLNEYTTVIGTYHLPNSINRRKVTISMDIDESGRISIAIDGAAAVPQAATHVDLNNEAYKKGLWPMLNN